MFYKRFAMEKGNGRFESASCALTCWGSCQDCHPFACYFLYRSLLAPSVIFHSIAELGPVRRHSRKPPATSFQASSSESRAPEASNSVVRIYTDLRDLPPSEGTHILRRGVCVYREESIDIPSERKPIEPWCGVIVAVSSSASEDFYQKRLSRPRPPHCFVEPGRKSACVCVCVERPFEGCLTIISGTFLVFLGASLHAYWFLCPKKKILSCVP